MAPRPSRIDPRLAAALAVQFEQWRAALRGGAGRVGWKLGMGHGERIGDEVAIGHLTSATLLDPGATYAAGTPPTSVPTPRSPSRSAGRSRPTPTRSPPARPSPASGSPWRSATWSVVQVPIKVGDQVTAISG